MTDVQQMLEEIRTLAEHHSVKVPIVYGDGEEAEDRAIFLDELGIILSEIEVGYSETPTEEHGVQMMISLPEDMVKWINNPNCPPDYGVGDFVDIIKRGTVIPP